MLRNFFKLITAVFLLAFFLAPQSSFAQTTLIDPTQAGGLELGTTFPDNGWTVINGTTNRWWVGSAPVTSAGTNAAFTGPDGITWLGESPANVNHFYRDIVFPAGETVITLQFKYKILAVDATYDYLKVFLVPTTTTPVAGTQLTTGQLGVNYETATAYTLITLTVPAANAGTTQRLVFSWRTDGFAPAAAVAVDEISLVSRLPVIPAPPISFTATGVSATGMTVGWTDNSTDETSFRVYRSTDNITFTQVGSDIPTTSGATTGTLYSQIQSGLVPSTLYYFRIVAMFEAESPYLTGSQSTTATGNITSVASGLWDATTTWAGGVVPTIDDNVTIATGHTVTINSSNAYSILVQNGGVLQFEDVTARTLTVATNVTINAGGTFQSNPAGTVTTHVLSLGGNLTNNGTLDFSTNTNLAGAGIIFTGASNNTFGGSGATTDLRTLTINKGTSRNNILELNPSNFTVQGTTTDGTPMAFLTITNGTLKISESFTMTSRLFAGAAAYSIPASGGLWINNPNFTVAGQNGSPTVNGLFRMTAGTYNIGTGTGNSMGFGIGSTIIVEGGAINATGRFGVSTSTNTITYTQTGGVITVCTIGNASASLCSFDLGTSLTSTVSVSAGTIIIQKASSGTTKRDYRYQGGTGIGSVTGGTVQIGDASSGIAGAYTIYGVVPNLVINGSFAHTVTWGGPVNWNNISRDITINSTTTLNIGSNVFLFSGSTFTNNGTFTANGTCNQLCLVWCRNVIKTCWKLPCNSQYRKYGFYFC